MKPKILFVCTACPFGSSGSGVRTFHLAKQLEKLGPVTMVAATGQAWTPEQLAQTRAAFNLAEYIIYQESPVRGIVERFRQVFDPKFMNSNGVVVPAAELQRVASLVESHDLVWIHTLKLANSFRRYRWPKTVMDVDDIPSRYHEMAATHALTTNDRLRRWRNAFAARRSERLCLDRFSILTICKEGDRAHFNGDPRVHVIPNGFAVPPSMHARNVRTAGPRIGMIGDFTHLPNSDGLKWFLQQAWLEVRQAVPNAELRLIGKASDSTAQSLEQEGIAGLGYVPDTGAEISSWSAMIVPTRMGGGTHLKVAEGLARRVPIVTTQHGARGYDVEPGRHLLIADSGPDFAQACVRLLQNEAEGERFAQAGWELFVARYSWDSIGTAVESAVNACLARG